MYNYIYVDATTYQHNVTMMVSYLKISVYMHSAKSVYMRNVCMCTCGLSILLLLLQYYCTVLSLSVRTYGVFYLCF